MEDLVNALEPACPACSAAPGEMCEDADRYLRLSQVAIHPSRARAVALLNLRTAATEKGQQLAAVGIQKGQVLFQKGLLKAVDRYGEEAVTTRLGQIQAGIDVATTKTRELIGEYGPVAMKAAEDYGPAVRKVGTMAKTAFSRWRNR